LISNGTVLACFPLHDSDPHVAPVKDSAGERHFLHQNWAGYKNVYGAGKKEKSKRERKSEKEDDEEKEDKSILL
jgi:hypothetical protein